MPGHRSYPKDLAARIRTAWPSEGLPLPDGLERILDTAYHASFLRDEERPVTFRVLCLDPDVLPQDEGPPTGLQPLAFAEHRDFDEHEIRRLSPAAKYHRALIGICERAGRVQTWGIVQSGPRWLQSAHGGRAAEALMPACLVVRVIRPGHLAVSCGLRAVAELRGGKLVDITIDVFQSKWLAALFRAERIDPDGAGSRELRTSLVEAFDRLHQNGEITSNIDEAVALARFVAQQMLKRVIAVMRGSHHGGTIVVLPSDCTSTRFLASKYPIAEGEPRRRFRRLSLAILKEVENQRVSREPLAAYQSTSVDTLSELDDALFELSSLIGSLAEVDGAVVLTKRFEILGFGAEILGNLPPVSTVSRALDLEADTTCIEPADGVGTRHRSAYRLCAAVPGAIALVVSQDGNVRFVTLRPAGVTYWDHAAGDE